MKSKDNLQDSVLPFYHVHSSTRPHVVRLGGQHLYPSQRPVSVAVLLTRSHKQTWPLLISQFLEFYVALCVWVWVSGYFGFCFLRTPHEINS